eukprot:NODE_615_length_5971_cov_0.202486.p4 type:complete len:147 gc:universal NODE_615_length_5971_cov_0.202486:577-1017(+)
MSTVENAITEPIAESVNLLGPESKTNIFENLLFLGKLYESKNQNEPAFKCYAEAFNNGYHLAAIPLSRCYLEGKGVQSHVVKAVKILESVLDHEIDAYYELAMIHYSYQSKKSKELLKKGKAKGCIKCSKKLKNQSRSGFNKIFSL